MVCFGDHFTPKKKHLKCIIVLSIKIKVTKPKPLMINNGWFTSFEKRNGKTVIILIDLQLSQVTRNNFDSVFFKGGEISEEPKKENTNTTKIHMKLKAKKFLIIKTQFLYSSSCIFLWPVINQITSLQMTCSLLQSLLCSFSIISA